jgi:hypothetical protein
LNFEEQLEQILRRAATTPEEVKAAEDAFSKLVFGMSAEEFCDSRTPRKRAVVSVSKA